MGMMRNNPYIAHSELTNEIYIIDRQTKYPVTDQVVKAVVATDRAIPKEQYETRLKADMVAMLEDLDLQIDEFDSGCGWEGYIKKIDVHKLIRQKINEPTTKNDLGVDAISRADAIRVASGYCHPANVAKELAKLPPATPQEPKWIPCSEKKPNEGGEYLLWGKIVESEEEDYCFIGDYHEFDEMFGTEISNYDPKTLGFIDTEIEEYYSVVAWMPLPKAYSEVEE